MYRAIFEIGPFNPILRYIKMYVCIYNVCILRLGTTLKTLYTDCTVVVSKYKQYSET